MSAPNATLVKNIAADCGVALDAQVANDLAQLDEACRPEFALLLSFGSGVIVPSAIIERPGLLALNVHAASPQYPGRDPHHFAVYDDAKHYGATMHYMTRHVDEGPIICVEMFDVPADTSPSRLLALADNAGFRLVKQFFAHFGKYGSPPAVLDVNWGPRKTTRRMFLDLCRIDPTLSAQELQRRVRATEMPGFSNLFIDLHGHRFRLEGPTT